MKVNELRIGSLVYYNKPVRKEVTISGILSQGLYYKGNDKGCLCDFQFDPIPLTKEWLLKLGFEIESEDDDYWYFLSNKTCVFGISLFKKEDYWIFYDSDAKIKYVHQLQNLYLSLVGEELELKESTFLP